MPLLYYISFMIVSSKLDATRFIFKEFVEICYR